MLLDGGGEPVRKVRTCADMSPEKIAEINDLLDAAIAEVKRQHPDFEWLYVAKHWDEVHPHVQMAGVPMTADGRINFKEVMSDGTTTKGGAQAAYRRRHDEMRMMLQGEGYDATMERIDDGKRHLGLAAHKREQERIAKQAIQAVKVRTRETTVRVQEKTLTALADDLRARELEVNARGAEAAQALTAARVEAARIKALAVADGRQEGRKEMEAAVAAAWAVERELVAERARLQQLAAQRPPLPTVEQLLQRDPARMASWMKKFTVKDGSTLYDMYEKAQRAEHAKRSDWKVGAAQIKDPYDEWLAKAEAVTVGDAGKQHQRRLEQISARAAEIGQPGRYDEAQYGG